MQDEPIYLDAHTPVQRPLPRKGQFVGLVLGAGVGMLLGLALSFLVAEWNRILLCGLGVGLGAPVGMLLGRVLNRKDPGLPPGS